MKRGDLIRHLALQSGISALYFTLDKSASKSIILPSW